MNIHEYFGKIAKIFVIFANIRNTKNIFVRFIRTNKIFFRANKKFYTNKKSLRPNKKIFVRLKKFLAEYFYFRKKILKFSCWTTNFRPNENIFVQRFGNFVRNKQRSRPIPNSRKTNIRILTNSIVYRPWYSSNF